ncbi:hypothetical protein DACRYDRAFT_20724 [Dacryopinax primogenitus]|uniref:Uncharacterized protein n=1 Tax=Dacryopinax primogenitus (strain DJM 731) TaxID=1858805 RepID=M5GCT8_DACPD|nr:uncharacterized protein DACRYDRAFT_20724 [Dacryopinax primogenitus]EJU04057.1 hypothetical protein DACRYDRAFT_20724 [Dacryopinax primogenitus]
MPEWGAIGGLLLERYMSETFSSPSVWELGRLSPAHDLNAELVSYVVRPTLDSLIRWLHIGGQGPFDIRTSAEQPASTMFSTERYDTTAPDLQLRSGVLYTPDTINHPTFDSFLLKDTSSGRGREALLVRAVSRQEQVVKAEGIDWLRKHGVTTFVYLVVCGTCIGGRRLCFPPEVDRLLRGKYHVHIPEGDDTAVLV